MSSIFLGKGKIFCRRVMAFGAKMALFPVALAGCCNRAAAVARARSTLGCAGLGADHPTDWTALLANLIYEKYPSQSLQEQPR